MSENVFLVVIKSTSVVRQDHQRPGIVHGYFDVIETYKGSAQGVPYIAVGETLGTTCSLKIEQEKRYYVFTDEDGPVWYNMCSNTVHEMWHEQKELQMLRDSE